ncbi:MAG TPA: M1 family aminopeptidase [Dongiaceae bacterium]|nr:M1 family aminopeptidase [Dongiaceae bacterium]
MQYYCGTNSFGVKHNPFILPGSTTHYARDRDYDIQHVRLDLTVDPEKKRLEGTAHITLKPITENVTRLDFDGVELEVKEVKLSDNRNGSGSRKVNYENTGRKIIVYLDRALKTADNVTVSIRYSGQPRRGLYFVGPDKAYPKKPYQVWTQGEDEDNRYWFPSYDYPNDRTTSEVIVTVPDKYMAVSNGMLVETKDDKAKGLKVFHWKQDIPHVNYLISLVVGEYSVTKENVDGVELQYYLPKGREEEGKRSFEKTGQMVRFFSEYFGVKYPYPKYAQVVVSDFIFGGMENITATTLTDTTLHDKRAHLDFTSDDLVAHELAHQWWGDLITCRDWSHAWLNEGFATYSEVLFKEHDLGRDEAAYYQMHDLELYLEEDKERYRRPIVSKIYMNPGELFDRHLYEKGGLVLHALRNYLGDDNFQKGLKQYAERYREKVVETNDFRRTLEDVTGRDLEGFFDQWVYHSGLPEFKVTYDWDDNAMIAKLTVSQTQSTELETPLVFQTPVDISFTLAKGVVTKRVTITQRDQVFFFSLPEKPRDVEFDPGNWIPKDLDFDKPKTMLLFQLQGDKNMVGRARAAQRLSKYPTEDVVSSLKDTILKDPFWGVQAEAAKSLGTIRTNAALRALIAGLKTKHPKARRAVVKALGEFRDEEAAKELIEIVQDTDPSYYVEAEASRSLGKTRSAKAFEVLKAALRKDSFNEVIRSGVFDGYAELKNPNAIPIVTEWTRYGKPNFAREAAVRALAKLGEGKPEVSDILTSLLDDQWFKVRLEAAVGLGNLLDPKSLPALEQLVSKELDGRVKRRARESIRKIQMGREATDEFRQMREDIDKLRDENRLLKERLDRLESVPPKK